MSEEASYLFDIILEGGHLMTVERLGDFFEHIIYLRMPDCYE
jgi:hypothetical protein